ncbi:3-isopropylmalate dehydratase small subunit [Roseovarius pelagicus]|uniref:3-isopropylmalate dehydratase small subunit n=1 Tax=Roseovarius pelagicus TaxID=2980108 RepID=UPI00357166C6
MSILIERVSGRGLPLAGNDIDTDQIIESRYLRMTTFEGIEAHLFESLRQASTHPFDDSRFAGASVLIVGRNFGCGSSREHAPQALYRYGIRAIVGESFGEIFAGNCLAIGIPCLSLTSQNCRMLMNICLAHPERPFDIDIRDGIICTYTQRFEFDLPPGRRERLLNGSWDALQVLLSEKTLIEEKLMYLPQVLRR